MRVLLVGPPAARARLRAALRGSSIDIVDEYDTLAAAQSSSAAADGILLAPVARAGSTRDPAATDAGSLEEPLTPREVQVLELLADGLSNKAIAAELAVSDQTVKFHVASILAKLGAANRTDAVRRAVRRGLLTL